MWNYCLILVFLFISGCVAGSRVVNTAQGQVKGYSNDGGGFFTFYSIPYAKAPSGRDRFKAPLPAPKRPYILEAIDKGIVCPQPIDLWDLYNRSLVITEDCLIANVFVPDTDKTDLPVLVYVHGGGYAIGYGNFLTYENLVKTKDLVVVTFNYRLGPHGFLCLGTDDIPGNAGMKDQVALLRWVKDNIANFGGNPNDVTIAGYSAGASAVSLLMLSKMARGLFTKVIPESGTDIASWSVQVDPIWIAKEYARLLNFSNYNDLESLEEFYKTTSYEILSFEAFKIMGRTDTFSLSPCVERDTEGEEFLTDSPMNILKSGDYPKLPILHGFAQMEGLMRVVVFDEWKDRMNENFSDFLPLNLKFETKEERNSVANKIKRFYFGDDPVNEENILNYVNFISDMVIAYPTLKSVQLHLDAGHDKIYLYEYAFVSEDVPIIPHTEIRGADHCAQSVMVGDGNLTHTDDMIFTQEYRQMKKVVRELWSNFVIKGQPVPDGSDLPSWPPVNKDWSPHMVIDNPLRLSGSLLKERALFWDEIYEKHYRNPSSPQKLPKINSEL
ncbi:unnamed protein product [Leptosia nina]|uniref:Carboxylic ester hydrolase n=1 Tax=Leptosia nina TaxID=320188 RepID=A0AAV1JJJ4_9NEOP